MVASFLLHLYQPSYQEPDMLKKVTEESYIPLVKFLKSCKNFNVTINMPLSLLAVLDKAGYHQLLTDIKMLVSRNQVELVGSAAYHALLPKLNSFYREKQIILNEYALGYYFGRKLGFEGEKSILINDIRGFFPPELAIDSETIATIEALGYQWVVVDEVFSFKDGEPLGSGLFYLTKKSPFVLIARNRSLSNLLAFKRDSEIDATLENALSSSNPVIAVLDGETFGHHNREGINLLYNINDYFHKREVPLVTLSGYLEEVSPKDAADITPSSWGASKDDIVSGNPYPIWERNGASQEILWKILSYIQENISLDPSVLLNEDYANANLWDSREVSASVKEPETKKEIVLQDLVLRTQNSDQFWWTSSRDLPSGDHLYSKKMLSRNIVLLESLVKLLGSTPQAAELTKLIEKLKKSLE